MNCKDPKQSPEGKHMVRELIQDTEILRKKSKTATAADKEIAGVRSRMVERGPIAVIVFKP